MITEKELKHHRLQAYRIGPHEITSDQFEDIEFAGEVEV